MTYALLAQMAKRQRLSAPAAGPAILPAGVAVIPKRSSAIAERFLGHCSNASTCMSKCRDCRRPNCVPMRRPANPAMSFAHASSMRVKCNDNAPGAATHIWINRKRMRCAGLRLMIRRCWKTRSICCNSRRVRCTVSSGWRGRLPILRAASISSGRMWPKPSGIGAGNGW